MPELDFELLSAEPKKPVPWHPFREATLHMNVPPATLGRWLKAEVIRPKKGETQEVLYPRRLR